MKQTSSRTIKYVMKELHARYEFMLEKGYEVISVEDAEVGWQAMLRRGDLLAMILHTRGDDYVSFRAATEPPQEFTELRGVIYAATGEIVPWSGDDTKELQKYLDRIETYFAEGYVKNPDGLRAAANVYRESLPKFEPVIPAGPGIPKEQKKNPILNYLMTGIILLLIFFFLATLCGVVVDRLFAVFTP